MGKILGMKLSKCQKLTLSNTGVAFYRGAVFPVKKFRVSKYLYGSKILKLSLFQLVAKLDVVSDAFDPSKKEIHETSA